jgi:Sulfotransferase family
MREHLPSVLIRSSVVLRAGVHLCRHFAHLLGVGLLSLRSSPRLSSSRDRGKRSMSVRNPTRQASVFSVAKDEDSRKENDSLVPDASRTSVLSTETSSPAKNENLIISIHVPKTGGTAFREVLRGCAEEVFYLDYGFEPPGPTALFRRGEPLTAPFESIVSELESLPGRSVIHGHFPAKKYVGRFPTAVYVTWLRDPIERVVSNYLYWQRSQIPGDVLWEQVTEQKMSLEQFARLNFTRDIQQAFLHPLSVEDFDFIGITEEYDRSLELFRRLFCPHVRVDAAVKNDNPNRQGKFYDLDPEVRRKIQLLNERDVRTYLDGVRRFRYLCEQVGL